MTLADRIQVECPCPVIWTAAMGTFDAVTDEWLPNCPTLHVHLVVEPDCPFHGSKAG